MNKVAERVIALAVLAVAAIMAVAAINRELGKWHEIKPGYPDRAFVVDEDGRITPYEEYFPK